MEARLTFLGHTLTNNRCGLLVGACLTPANGHAERGAALVMIEPRADRPVAVTLGADKGYDAADFVNDLRSMNARPQVAQNTTRRFGRFAIDKRTTRHAGYVASQRIRKRIEEAFGWMNPQYRSLCKRLADHWLTRSPLFIVSNETVQCGATGWCINQRKPEIQFILSRSKRWLR